MKDQSLTRAKSPLARFVISNAVPILFIVLLIFAIPLSGFSIDYLINEIITRLGRNSFLVISLLIPVMAGMGLNFGIVLGAMAGQIGLIFMLDWGVVGIPGILLAMLIGTPIAILLGLLAGTILNRAKGREMVTSMILGFFINGIYQLTILYGMGSLIPITSNKILLPRGYGVRNALDLISVRKVLDNMWSINIGNISIPLGVFSIIIGLCVFVYWFTKTKLGQDMRAVGQDMQVAATAGINVDRTRTLSIIISTVLACFGQIIFLQNIGTINTYNSHDQVGTFAIAALLIGGASVVKATIPNVFIGITLFHLTFIVAPRAGKELLGQAQIGEFFRVFVSYGIIAISLALYAWRRQVEKETERRQAKAAIKAAIEDRAEG
ncbi:MAG TPA: ABC transporter permease [Mesotoga infera]|jgi:simple sugar transport system permease protein|uniref:Permease component of ribose/xylose/arabinose/galactoside ABC-type transporters n=1 Tax=Mesotoga infera TaxID=1236046 RepID=A0A7Z7PMV2_9BACT|nr:ABC transporter permease [Mesotoga infera]MBP8661574.1 ABC transporter permease [Mesotoga sp.]NLI07114.1 ABC transporter permease [Thermotogaceae bacterium]SSC11502.1 Permease component of ribose/xylose/arabinose/galactoside ABC-type transporters [Mesotoga infera]HNS66813.1 ABC transporter permease [Mesotoga infera]HOI33924.1 ABC transporter permease [Mesotoga infera]